MATGPKTILPTLTGGRFVSSFLGVGIPAHTLQLRVADIAELNNVSLWPDHYSVLPCWENQATDKAQDERSDLKSRFSKNTTQGGGRTCGSPVGPSHYLLSPLSTSTNADLSLSSPNPLTTCRGLPGRAAGSFYGEHHPKAKTSSTSSLNSIKHVEASGQNSQTSTVSTVKLPTLSSITLASISPAMTARLEKILNPLLAKTPNSLGFPGPGAQSAYYLGPEIITKDDIAAVTEVMEEHSIEPENTRLRKTALENTGTVPVFDILLASAESCNNMAELTAHSPALRVRTNNGDHAAELSKICAALKEATNYASNKTQVKLLQEYTESFTTGSSDAYRQSQKTWVTDLSPVVEGIFGFVEPYRDPYGMRAEWEGIVSISDPEETRKLAGLVSNSSEIISLLPWAVEGDNDGKGPFEATFFRAPDFTIVHALACCASVVWDGVNLPNYSDIRETCGSKNILFSNPMAIRVESHPPSRHVHPSEAEQLKSHTQMINFVTASLHELIGHGSGKLLCETAPNVYNFDKERPPMNPLTGRAIESWFGLGQTWTGVFGKLATTVEECRANLISYYLADEKRVLRVFGLENENTIADFLYFVYLTIGVRGIDALASFNAEDQSWGDQHARGSWVILRHLLLDGDGATTVDHSPATGALHVHVDRSKILSHGKPSLGRLLLRLHIWHCTADIQTCREFYEALSTVDGQYEAWRQTAVAAWSQQSSSLVQLEPGSKILQPNSFVTEDGKVELKVYEASNEGIIQSFVDRGIWK